jgi:hypothetical protein
MYWQKKSTAIIGYARTSTRDQEAGLQAQIRGRSVRTGGIGLLSFPDASAPLEVVFDQASDGFRFGLDTEVFNGA